MTVGAAFCVALAVAGGFDAAPSPAGDGEIVPSIVLLLAGRDTEPLAGRLAAELMGVGLEVQREEPSDSEAPDPVASALRVRARAAIWVPPGTAAAEVWIIDRAAGRATIRQSITAEGEGMSPLVAVRTVEFLRASLLGRGATAGAAAPRPRRPSTAAAAERQRGEGETEAPATDEPSLSATGGDSSVSRAGGEAGEPGPRISVAVGAGVIASPGGIGPIPSIAAVVRVPLHGRLGVEALGLLSAAPAHIPNDVSVTVSLAGAGLALRLAGGARGSVDVGAGGMGVFVRAVGERQQAATVGAVYGRLGGGFSFTPWLGLRAEALIGTVLARPVLRAANDPANAPNLAVWGRPFGGGMLNLEARWM